MMLDMASNYLVVSIQYEALTKVMIGLCAAWYIYWGFRG